MLIKGIHPQRLLLFMLLALGMLSIMLPWSKDIFGLNGGYSTMTGLLTLMGMLGMIVLNVLVPFRLPIPRMLAMVLLAISIGLFFMQGLFVLDSFYSNQGGFGREEFQELHRKELRIGVYSSMLCMFSNIMVLLFYPARTPRTY